VWQSEIPFGGVHSWPLSSATLRRLSLSHAAHMQYTAAHKQSILTHYQAGVRGAGFAALARRFAVQGGAGVIQRWHAQWDKTVQSLEEKPRPGRPRVLSKTQVTRHVAAPIRNSNRAARVVRYGRLLPQVQAATGTNVSLRTLQRYGHDEAEGRQTRGKKRTADECECTDTGERGEECVCLLQHADTYACCVCVTSSVC
jgi:hypothetical protein